MKKIFCLINIEEKGLHALFCRLGFHQFEQIQKGSYAPQRFCYYCPRFKENK